MSSSRKAGTARPARRGRAGAAFLSALALCLIPACSSATGGTSSAGSPAGSVVSSATVGPGTATGSPIVLGNIGTYSGSFATTDLGALAAIKAWASYVNAEGGISNHPVKLIAMDDALNSSTALADAKQLVQQDHVAAFISTFDILEPVWQSYVEGMKIPVVGDNLTTPAMGTLPGFYPEGAGPQQPGSGSIARQVGSLFLGELATAKAVGHTKLAELYCAESAQCKVPQQPLKQAASAMGVDYVYTAAVSATAPDYTAQCLGAKAAGANYVFIAQDGVTAARIIADCHTQGYFPDFSVGNNVFLDNFKANSALDGLVGPVNDFPWFDSNTPAQALFQKEFKQYAPSGLAASSPEYSESAANGWASGVILQTALGNSPKAALTPSGIETALAALPAGDTFGGLTPPLTFTKSGAQPLSYCDYAIKLSGGKWTDLNGGKVICPPTSLTE